MATRMTSQNPAEVGEAQDRVHGAWLQPYSVAHWRDTPKNRIAITVWPDAASEQAYWNETKDNFKIGQKYATDMRLNSVEGVAQN